MLQNTALFTLELTLFGIRILLDKSCFYNLRSPNHLELINVETKMHQSDSPNVSYSDALPLLLETILSFSLHCRMRIERTELQVVTVLYFFVEKFKSKYCL